MRLDQKQRDRAALVMVLVLAPVFLMLLYSTIRKVRSRRVTGVVPVQASPPGGAAGALPQPVTSQAERPVQHGVPTGLLDEQRRIAGLKPDRDPFSRSSMRVRSNRSQDGRRDPSEIKLNVSGIMVREGRRVVIIDGDVLGEGDRLGDWVVQSITANSVVLDNGREKRVLNLRQ